MLEANLSNAHLEGANIEGAYLMKATLNGAYMKGTLLLDAYLMEASLFGAHLEGATLFAAHLEEANLDRAFFDDETSLEYVFLATGEYTFSGIPDIQDIRDAMVLGKKKYGAASLGDVHWNGVDITVVDWSQVKKLGNERSLGKGTNALGYRHVVRAYRQVAAQLRDHGLNEDADRFAYRAQKLQRVVFRRQRKFGQYVFSGFLDLIAGYGYRPGRSLIAYLFIIFGFMGLYLLNSHFVCPHLRWDEALVLSLSSFHGRGFFSQDITLGDTYARLAAAEAVVGLLIEISFIATFTQRFFGK